MSLFRLYLISPVILGVIVHQHNSSKEYKKRLFVLVYGFITFLFFSLRTQFLGSGDSLFYYSFWEDLSRTPFTWDSLLEVLSTDLEKGYLLFVWLFSHILSNGQFMFVFAGLFISVGISLFIFHNCEDYVLAALVINGLGLTGFMLQGTRQAIAISLCLLSYKYCRERKIIPFAILMLFACLFHASALLFAVTFFVYGIKLNWKSFVIIVICFVFSQRIISVITQLANFFMNEHYEGGNTDLTSGGIFTLITLIFLIVYCLLVMNSFNCDTNSKEYTDYSCGFFLMLICTLLFSMRFFYITVFERGCYYFIPFIAIAIQNTYKRFTVKSQRIIAFSFCCLFFAWALYKSQSSSMLSNYTFFWMI